MLVRIWIVVERPLRRTFFRPCLQGGELLKCRQVVATAGCDKLLNRGWLRQLHQQALRGFLVFGKVPRSPEIGEERRKPAFRSGGEAVRPALFGDLRRV